jgi:hypothetical protein
MHCRSRKRISEWCVTYDVNGMAATRVERMVLIVATNKEDRPASSGVF